MWHSHRWGKVEGVHQYCTKCGIARILPCNHEWEVYNQATITAFGASKGILYVLRCTKCGTIIKKTIISSECI